MDDPIAKEFKGDDSILSIQKALVTYTTK